MNTYRDTRTQSAVAYLLVTFWVSPFQTSPIFAVKKLKVKYSITVKIVTACDIVIKVLRSRGINNKC